MFRPASNKKNRKNEVKADVTLLYEMYDPDNPYALGRKEYDDRYERLTKNASAWRRIAFLMLALLTVSISVVLWMAQSVKVVPFIVQVDEHGYEIAVQQVAATNAADDRVIMARVADFITNTRSVYNDRTATMSLVVKSYDSVETGSPAQGKLDTYFRENNPLSKNLLVTVTMQSVLRATPESNKLWQAEWYERIYEQGRFTKEHYYKGMYEIEVNTPTSLRDIMKNPLGVFIHDFHITEKLEPNNTHNMEGLK